MAFPSAQDIEAVLKEPVAAYQVVVDSVTVKKAGPHSSVVVVIDGDNQPSLELLEEITPDVSAALDAAEERGELEFGAQGYTLEVTTRGVDSPLTLPRHWRANTTRLVAITGYQGHDDLIGRIGAVNEAGTQVEIVNPRPVAATKGKGHPQQQNRQAAQLPVEVFDLDQFGAAATAQVQVEFSSPPSAEVERATEEFGADMPTNEGNK